MMPLGKPGTAFLRLVRRVFPEIVVERVFLPAVADLQGEWRECSSRLGRVRVHLRGALSLTILAIVTPLDVLTSLRTAESVPRRPHNGGWFLLLLASTLYAVTWPIFGLFSVSALVLGVVAACVMRGWNVRHPANTIDALQRVQQPRAEINLSAIPVGGDIAGLMFAVGSVIIVAIGLPGLWWYVAAVAVGSLLVASAVFAWHAAHPDAHRAVHFNH